MHINILQNIIKKLSLFRSYKTKALNTTYNCSFTIGVIKMKKTLCALTIALASLVGCRQKPEVSNLDNIALKEYQEARQEFSDKEWKTTWSPDGENKIVSYVDHENSYHYIFSLNGDETECKNLSNPVIWDSSPIYHPDGRVAWTLNIGENIEIYVMDKDGSNQTNLTNKPVEDYSESTGDK